MIKDFEDLIIYKKSRILAKQVFDATKDSPFAHDYRFVQQIRAAAGSIIAIILLKDLKDKGNKEFKNFLYIAKGSCGEVRSQLNRAFDFGYINEAVYQQMYNDCKILGSAILHFILSLKSSDFVGTKYHDKSQDSNE